MTDSIADNSSEEAQNKHNDEQSEAKAAAQTAAPQESSASPTWRRPLIAFIAALIILGGFAWAWNGKTRNDHAEALASCQSAHSTAAAKQAEYQTAVASAKKLLADSHADGSEDPKSLEALSKLASALSPSAKLVECRAEDGIPALDAASRSNRKAADAFAAARTITAAQNNVETGVARRR